MPKRWLSYDEQVDLLRERGMTIDDPAAAAAFLSRVNYYRLSGYFRHWQVDPKHGDNQFLQGTSFDVVRGVYEAEEQLLAVCDDLLHPLEVALRTRFAHAYGRSVGVSGAFATGQGFTRPRSPSSLPVEEYVLDNLQRSKEAFVAHYRDDIREGRRFLPEAYSRMPIWVAVEAFSFTTLSRLIAASDGSGVLDDVAESLGTSRRLLPGQVRSFVYLRNRIAHCAQLWNHSVLDVPGLQPKRVRQVKQRNRNFGDHSVYKICIALDDLATRSGIRSGWLEERVEPLLIANPLLEHGICKPSRYGEMPRALLLTPSRAGDDGADTRTLLE